MRDQSDEVMSLLEMHVYENFEDEDSDEDEVGLPYVVTIDYDSQKVVSIRRNWQEDDEKKLRRDWFVSYKFLPGLGFYGFVFITLSVALGKRLQDL